MDNIYILGCLAINASLDKRNKTENNAVVWNEHASMVF